MKIKWILRDNFPYKKTELYKIDNGIEPYDLKELDVYIKSEPTIIWSEGIGLYNPKESDSIYINQKRYSIISKSHGECCFILNNDLYPVHLTVDGCLYVEIEISECVDCNEDVIMK